MDSKSEFITLLSEKVIKNTEWKELIVVDEKKAGREQHKTSSHWL